MKNNKDNYKDNGMTVADMSGIEKPNLFGFRNPNQDDDSKPNISSNSEPLDKETRKWAILGALKASLLVALAYIVGLGLVILLLVLFYKHVA